MKVLLTKKMRLITLLVFIILTVIGAGLSPLVKINYDPTFTLVVRQTYLFLLNSL